MVLQLQIDLGQRDVLEGLPSWSPIGVAEVDIFKPVVLPNLVVIRDVYTDRHRRACKGQYLETGKVGFLELLDLEVLSPWQVTDNLLGQVHELSEYL